MSKDEIGGYVLDVAAVVGICRRDPYPDAIWWSTVHSGDVIAVPAAVLAEACAWIRSTEQDILEVLLGTPYVIVPSLDDVAAQRCGTLLAEIPTEFRNEIAAAHVVLEAVRRGWPAATARPALLASLDSTVRVDVLP